MKAIRLSNSAAAFTEASLPQPIPGNNELLIRVKAAGVTPSELGWYPTRFQKDGSVRTGAIPGHEFSGVVAAIGEITQTLPADLQIGAAVYGMNDWFAEGATAEFCIATPAAIAAKPSTLTFEQSATVPISALTAWEGLMDRARIQASDRVLVHGGAGTVGLFAVQLAHRVGAYVIATVSADDLAFVRDLGADEAIDYRSVPFESVVRQADVVFDTVGGETLARSWQVLRTGGRMVTVASDAGASSDSRTKEAFFIVESNGARLREIAKLIDGGELRVFVKAVFPLNQAYSAYFEKTAMAGKRGKIVISLSGDD